MPATAELGTADSQLGQFILGTVASARSGAGVIPKQPALVSEGQPYLAHLYKNDGITFKKTFQLLTAPPLKYTANAGYHELVIDVESWDQSSAGPVAGDLVRVSQQGGDGSIVYTGIVNDVVDDIAPGKASHQLWLVPLITEFGDAYFNKQYVTATDVAQFVRDAAAATAHCWVTPESCPDSGILGVWNFNNTTPLEALTIARRIAGVNAYFFVDHVGQVWFGQANTSAPAAYTVKRGADYNARKRSSPLGQLKNKIMALGGYPTGAILPITSKYPAVEPSASQLQYGVRMLQPLVFPTVTSQSTLDKLVATYGAILDRLQLRGEITLQNFGQRVDLRRLGGATIRYWEPAIDSLVESEVGSGGDSPTYVVLDVEVDGPVQRIVFGDIPVTGVADIQPEIDRIVREVSALSAAY